MDTITKTVMQYSEPLPEETMEFLRGIAADYGKVKKHVYSRYAGIGSLDRLTPAFDIMAEVRHGGLPKRNLWAVPCGRGLVGIFIPKNRRERSLIWGA